MSFRLNLPPLFRRTDEIYSYLTREINRLNYALSFLDVPEASASVEIRTDDQPYKSTSISGNSTNSQYPTSKAVYEYAVPQTRTVNGHDLTDNVALIPEDLGEGDYVQSLHAGGIWAWRKWASGRADCYGVCEIVIPAGGMTALGDLYAYDKQEDFPADLFIAAPHQQATAYDGDIQFIVGNGSNAVSDTQASFAVIAAENPINAATVRVAVWATGRWKE